MSFLAAAMASSPDVKDYCYHWPLSCRVRSPCASLDHQGCELCKFCR